MDSDNNSYHFPKCQRHAYTRFENGCSENSTQKLLTKYSTEENNKHIFCWPRSVRIGKIVPSVLGTALALWPRPYSRPLAQFFPIQTSRPANNIYILHVSQFLMSWFVVIKFLILIHRSQRCSSVAHRSKS